MDSSWWIELGFLLVDTVGALLAWALDIQQGIWWWYDSFARARKGVLAQGGDVNAQYSKLTFTPTQADRFVLAFCSWLRTYGNSQPDWFPEANLSQPLPSTVLSKYEVGLPFSCALCVFPLAFLFGFLHMDESLMQHFSSVTVYYLVVCGSWLCSLYPFVIHSLWLLANLVSCDADVELVGATHIEVCIL